MNVMEILLAKHNTSLKRLEIQGGCDRWPIARGFAALETVAINFCREGKGNINYHWPYRMLMNSMKTLRELTIGFEREIIQAYEANLIEDFSDSGGILWFASHIASDNLATEWKEQRRASTAFATLSIDSLRLTGFDLHLLLTPSTGAFIDFSKLTCLSLESCAGLADGLKHLMTGTKLSSRPCRLRSLTVRTELGRDRQWSILESFVSSLSDLISLSILVEGVATLTDLETMLKTIGRSLRTLVIEERMGPRRTIAESMFILDSPISQLNHIADFCPNLIELGVTLDWSAVDNNLDVEEV